MRVQHPMTSLSVWRKDLLTEATDSIDPRRSRAAWNRKPGCTQETNLTRQHSPPAFQPMTIDLKQSFKGEISRRTRFDGDGHAVAQQGKFNNSCSHFLYCRFFFAYIHAPHASFPSLVRQGWLCPPHPGVAPPETAPLWRSSPAMIPRSFTAPGE